MIKQLLSVCILSVFLATNLFAADPPQPVPVGRVIWIKGTLRALMPNKEERSLQKTSIIYLHDTLITDAASQAQIAFTDNSLMTFRPSSKFIIDQYSFKPQAKKGSVGKYVMRLIEGGFRTITGLIAKGNPADYTINTPVATIGVRGTDYTVALDPNGQLLIGYYQGSPCVNNKHGSLCLDENNRYAKVDANIAPVALAQQPAIFRQQLEIVPAKIDPFSSISGSTSTEGSNRNNRGYTPTRNTSGPISSFCISQ